MDEKQIDSAKPAGEPQSSDLRELLLELVGCTDRPDWQIRASQLLATAPTPDSKAPEGFRSPYGVTGEDGKVVGDNSPFNPANNEIIRRVAEEAGKPVALSDERIDQIAESVDCHSCEYCDQRLHDFARAIAEAIHPSAADGVQEMEGGDEILGMVYEAFEAFHKRRGSNPDARAIKRPMTQGSLIDGLGSVFELFEQYEDFWLHWKDAPGVKQYIRAALVDSTKPEKAALERIVERCNPVPGYSVGIADDVRSIALAAIAASKESGK